MLTLMESALAITEAASGTDPDAGLRAVAALRALAERLECPRSCRHSACPGRH